MKAKTSILLILKGAVFLNLKYKKNDWIYTLILICLLIFGSIYYSFNIKPYNSIQLYQELNFSSEKEIQDLFLNKEVDNLLLEQISNIQSGIPTSINQMTFLNYSDKTIMVITTPGTLQLKVIDIEQLPPEIRSYFLQFLE